MRVFLQIIGEGRYKGFVISLTVEYREGRNLVRGKGYYRVKGINKKGNWVKRIEWKGPLVPPLHRHPDQKIINRTIEIKEKDLKKILTKTFII